nr:LysR substrate-binding domain-containing protein [Rhizobium leguminosarum]
MRLAVGPRGGPITSLIEERSSLAIVVGEDFRDRRIVLEAISSVEQVAVVSSEHPLACQPSSKTISLQDMADHLQIMLSDPTPFTEGRTFGVLSPRQVRLPIRTQSTR